MTTKINGVFAIVAVFLAPLAARADLVFVTYRAPMSDEIWSAGWVLFGVLGLPSLFGGGLLTWIYRRARRREPLDGIVVFRRWLIWFLVVFVLAMTMSALVPRPVFEGCGGHRRKIEKPKTGKYEAEAIQALEQGSHVIGGE